MRRLSVLLMLKVGLRVADFREAEIDGVMVVIDVGLREVRLFDLPIIDTLPELAAGCLVPVPIELPMRDLDALILEFDRLPELAAGCLAAEEADGLYMRIVLLLRDVLPELTRLLELAVDRLADEETDGILAVIELPILDLVLVVGCLVEEETDGLLIVIDLPMRAMLLGLSRMLEFRLTEVEPVELRLIEVLDDGLLEVEELGLLEIVIRFNVDPDELLREDIVPERLGADLLTVILELLRLGDERLTDDLTELLLLGVERLVVIVLDRLGLGALRMDVLLDLLLLEIERLELRPADIDLERLGVGARLTDDRLILLRAGAGARVGAAGLVA